MDPLHRVGKPVSSALKQSWGSGGVLRLCVTSYLLGCLTCSGLLIAAVQPCSIPSAFGLFLTLWCLFHWLEFFVTAIYHPGTISFQAFLLNHSKAFHVAVGAAVTEFFLEWLLLSNIKQLLLSYTGLFFVLTVCFQSMRTLSMVQAGSNFTHLVSHIKQPGHVLVTSGLYGIVRHPSYAAWFLWSVSTQLLLGNPLCAIGFAIVSWRFFCERIEHEEEQMVGFFGIEYIEYQRAVPSTGIPFYRTRRQQLLKSKRT